MQDVAVTLAAIVAITLYYAVTWLVFGRDPQPGSIVPQYEPPRGLSAAALRYYRIQRFDERVFLCGLLGLVVRGLAVIDKPKEDEEDPSIRVLWPPKREVKLPAEEGVLYKALCTEKARQGMRLTRLNDDVAKLAAKMCATLVNSGAERYFSNNRKIMVGGLALSLASVFVLARPNSPDKFAVLAFCLPVLLFPVGYLYLLVQRVVELMSVSKRHPQLPVAKRLFMMSLLVIPCFAGIVCGAVMLGVTFGMPILALLGALIFLNGLFLHLMKAPTREGRKLMDEIEGFREFLHCVEQLPLDRGQGPTTKTGLYEKYLPYALALEVEQEWCDQFAALTVGESDYIELDTKHSISLGLWDNKPVEFAPRARRAKGA